MIKMTWCGWWAGLNINKAMLNNNCNRANMSRIDIVNSNALATAGSQRYCQDN